MFKKSTIATGILFSVSLFVALFVAAALVCFGVPSQTKATSIENSFNLSTAIGSATVNYATADGNPTADYNGSPISMIKSITVGTEEVPMVSGETQNYSVAYSRGGNPTEDLTSAGVVDIVITGQNEYTGTIETSFTITKPEVRITFADTSDLKIDDTANLSLRNGSGLAAFISTEDGRAINIAEGDVFTTTYFNKTLGKSTNGFTNSGDYIVNVLYSSPNCTVVGPTSVEVYVKATVLQNKDGSVRVESKKGFKKGITLGETNVTTNERIIASRGDIADKQNVKALLNINFLKDGQACIIEDELFEDDELTITAKVGCEKADNMVVLNNDYANSAYKKVDFAFEDGNIVLTTKASSADVDNSSKEIGTNTYVLATETHISAIVIVTLAVTILALIALIVMNIVMYCGGSKKRK